MIYHILATLLCFGMFFFAYISIKKKVYNNKGVIKSLALFLITYKTIELSYGILNGNWAKYPVEFSTIFYFLFSIVILFDIKIMYGSTTAGAFISGFAYLVSLIPNINNMIATQSAINNMPGFILGMLSHSILFYLSVLIMTKFQFNYKQELKVINITALSIALHAFIAGKFIDFEDYYLLIYLILEGRLFPGFDRNGYLMFLQFIIILALYNGVVYLFYKLNTYMKNRFNNEEEPVITLASH